MRSQCYKALSSVLLILALLFPSVSLFSSPQSVQAADPEMWELRNAEWVDIGNNFTAKIFQSGFSGMKVDVASGVVSCYHTGNSTGESDNKTFNQKITVTLRGTYSDSSGMSGTYTFANQGTYTFEGRELPWSGTHSGSFNGTGGINENQPYIISFSGGDGIVIGGGGAGSAPYSPFQLRFMVGKGVDNSDHPKLSAITGQAEVLYQGELKWRPADLETILLPMIKIRTKDESVAIISCDDQSTYKLGPKSEVMIKISEKTEGKWQLVTGDLLLNATKTAEAASRSVEMNNCTVEIKGTTVSFTQSTTDSIVKVIEGAVDVKSEATGQTVNITTGEMVTATSTGIGQKTSFDIAQEQTRWQNIDKPSPPVQPPPDNGDNHQNTISLPECFIATAAYGSDTAQELDTLRAFRDKVLITNEPGRLFVEAYYTSSPPMAAFISQHEAVRTLVREVLLDPLVFLLEKSQAIWNN